MPQIDLDNVLDYRQAYSEIEGAKQTGDSIIGLCPFHMDTNASFSVNLHNGMYKCFACGAEGNYVSYVAQKRGLTTKDAYIAILKERGLDDRGVNAAKKTRPVCPDTYTVEDYAKEKQLDPQWLRDFWRMGEGQDKKVGAFVRIPYFNEQQEQTVFRKRYPKGASQRFSWGNGSAGKINLYGEWLLEHIREEGYVILCEGESDTQTLWHLGFPALGVPGASTFKAEWSARLAGLSVYLHIEPDQGGQTFRAQMLKKLHAGEFLGEVFTFSCGPAGSKDPSDIYIAKGKNEASAAIKAMLEVAKKVDLEEENTAEAIPGAPKNLRQPEGWIYSEKGISLIEERTQQPKCICRTPIILTKRMKNDLGEEKIEVAFRRDGTWTTAIFPRTVVFQSKSITCLADLGCTITSENAKHVVSFLQALEAENMDALDLIDSTSHCGWQSKERFIPGLGGDLVLDAPETLLKIAAGYCKNGTEEAWLESMVEHRKRNIFRAILAAGFAAPMLKVLNIRNFMLYNWGDSGTGKSAALKAALSVWGDPDKLMISFDSTQVALERRAGFFCDLPMGIDERQSAGDKQGFLERLVYMLANGVGRARASKDGGLQEVLAWRTIAIATGEEPLMQEATKGGVTNRILEIYGGPFDSEKQAVQMHQACSDNCGWAGPRFVRILRENQPQVQERYKWWLQRVSDYVSATKQAQAAAIALLALADESASKWLWNESETEAESRAWEMAQEIASAAAEAEPDDVNDRALNFVAGWVVTNWRNFQGAENAPTYGWIEDDGVFILPNVLRDALETAKFSYRKAMRFFADEGKVQKDRNGKCSVIRRNPKSKICVRVIAFEKSALLGEKEKPDAGIFSEITEQDEQLPWGFI